MVGGIGGAPRSGSPTLAIGRIMSERGRLCGGLPPGTPGHWDKSPCPKWTATIRNVLKALPVSGTSLMSEQFDTSSELVEISKLNGSFRRNYGTFIGAYLYLRSIGAARGRSLSWTGLSSIACSAALAWLARHGLAWLHVD